MNDPLQLKEIAQELRRLSATSPTEAALLSGWYEQSHAFAARLNTEFASIDVPEEVWHFLHDADTRLKDAQFRAAQTQMITEVIQDLERGVVPEPRGSTVVISGRHLIALAATVALAIALWLAL